MVDKENKWWQPSGIIIKVKNHSEYIIGFQVITFRFDWSSLTVEGFYSIISVIAKWEVVHADIIIV